MTPIPRNKLLIMGFGGHARSVADVALKCGFDEILFFDLNAYENESFLSFNVIADISGINFTGWTGFPGSGDSQKRREQTEHILSLGCSLATLVSPLANVSVGATIERGTFVGHHAHVGPFAKIGQGCIINTGSIVEHECEIGNFSHVSVNATIAGRSTMGSFSMLGAGATVIDGINICDHAIIGGGALVAKNIKTPGTYVGVPARKLA